jgi:hypothetical protein
VSCKMCRISHPALPVASTFAALIRTSASAGDWSSLLIFVEHMLAQVRGCLLNSNMFLFANSCKMRGFVLESFLLRVYCCKFSGEKYFLVSFA